MKWLKYWLNRNRQKRIIVFIIEQHVAVKSCYLFLVCLSQELDRTNVYFASNNSFGSILPPQSSPPSLTTTIKDRDSESQEDNESEDDSPNRDMGFGRNLLYQLLTHVFHGSRQDCCQRKKTKRDELKQQLESERRTGRGIRRSDDRKG